MTAVPENSRKWSGQAARMNGENALLERIGLGLVSGKLSRATLPLGIGDDAAIWQPRRGCQAILTCDWFLEGTHFLLDRHPADCVGWKSLARAVSDVAAMGAEPRCFLLSLALPGKRSGMWLDQFLAGLRRASQALRCPAAGGDTTRQDQVLINITVVGECKTGQAVPRSGARARDILYVTGRLGEAQFGLDLLRASSRLADPSDPRLSKHLYPRPRLAVAAWLATRGLVTAMMDLSDGLSSDLPRLCKASGVGARIAESLLPGVQLAPAEATSFDRLKLALHGGDDYELLFAVSAKNAPRIPHRIAGVPLTRIGQITASRSILLVTEEGRAVPLPSQGWDPFRKWPVIRNSDRDRR